MTSEATECILFEDFRQLGFTAELCLVCEIAGLRAPAELLEHHTSELLKLPGFNYHLLGEFICFLEKRNMGHLVDPE